MLDPLGSAFASSMPARSEQWPELSAHEPLPGCASCVSVVVLTVKVRVAADATAGDTTSSPVPAIKRAPAKVAALTLRFSNMTGPFVIAERAASYKRLTFRRAGAVTGVRTRHFGCLAGP